MMEAVLGPLPPSLATKCARLPGQVRRAAAPRGQGLPTSPPLPRPAWHGRPPAHMPHVFPLRALARAAAPAVLVLGPCAALRCWLACAHAMH